MELKEAQAIMKLVGSPEWQSLARVVFGEQRRIADAVMTSLCASESGRFAGLAMLVGNPLADTPGEGIFIDRARKRIAEERSRE